MPRKRRLSTFALERVARQLEDTRKSLQSTSRALNRHLKVNSKLVRRVEAFHDLFSDFEDMCAVSWAFHRGRERGD